MKKWIFITLVICLSGCAEKPADSWFTAAKALEYFGKIKELCDRDNGRLWGKNLSGPVMFVERGSRLIIANTPDANGILKEKDGVYTGYFPKEQIIRNAPVTFGGSRFTMVSLRSDKEDEYRVLSRAIRGLFHSYQETEGIPPAVFNLRNMDEKEARLWIKLEWKALRKAIESSGEERLRALRDALVFRGSNRELYSSYADEENSFETYEGLATFTYTKLYSTSDEEFTRRLIENLDRSYTLSSYSRSYGYIHGALYSSLLYDAGFDLKLIKTGATDLGEIAKKIYKIELPEICRDVAGSLAVSYDVDIINKEEEKRSSEIKERLHKLASTFTEKTVVFLELESPYFDFEPENIQPLDTLGTLYSVMRVSDNWGKLAVDKGGCLVSNNLRYLRITARGYQAEKNKISGEGWNLILNDGWQLVEVNQNYFLRKFIPL